MAITLEYLQSLLARELEEFDKYAVEYNMAVKTNNAWGIRRWEAEMDKYHDKASLIREIIEQFKKE